MDSGYLAVCLVIKSFKVIISSGRLCSQVGLCVYTMFHKKTIASTNVGQFSFFHPRTQQ